MNSVCEYLMVSGVLAAKGTAQVVRIGFSGNASAAYYHRQYVEKCIQEMDRVMTRVASGLGEATPLETLAIQLLMDSAYLKGNEDFDALMDEYHRRQAENQQTS